MTNSHILVQEFEWRQPTSIEQTLQILSRYGDRARVIAGGTDLIVQMKLERLAPECLVSLRHIPELEGISLRDDGLRIGAATPICRLTDLPGLAARYQALVEAAKAFSTSQTRVMGTVGGNLCNASPASETAPPLLAFDAEALIKGPEGERRLPLEEFFLGPGKTALRRGELLVSVGVPTPAPGTGSAFLKVSRVAADIAKVNAVAVLTREGDRIVDCRMAFGSVAPVPLRTRRAEGLMKGKLFGEETVLQAAATASEEVSPIDDVRSTAEYRREAVRVLAYDCLHLAWERAASNTRAAIDEANVGRRTPKPRNKASADLGLPATERRPIELMVNGQKTRGWVTPNDLLLNVLREDLGLTGTKYGCGIGECGACTVKMDGRPVLSCLVPVVAARGSSIVTVEGLSGADGRLDPLQEAFIRHAAVQCGYCTPGMLMTARSLLDENPKPTAEEVREYLKGNLCRCTGYASIVRAVMSCAHS